MQNGQTRLSTYFSILKKRVAVFFMFLIFVPFVLQTLHELEHHGEDHCIEKTEKHFHASEHHCSICHYTLTAFIFSDFTKVNLHLSNEIHTIYQMISFEFQQIAPIHFSLRAPPFLRN